METLIFGFLFLIILFLSALAAAQATGLLIQFIESGDFKEGLEAIADVSTKIRKLLRL